MFEKRLACDFTVPPVGLSFLVVFLYHSECWCSAGFFPDFSSLNGHGDKVTQFFDCELPANAFFLYSEPIFSFFHIFPWS